MANGFSSQYGACPQCGMPSGTMPGGPTGYAPQGGFGGGYGGFGGMPGPYGYGFSPGMGYGPSGWGGMCGPTWGGTYGPSTGFQGMMGPYGYGFSPGMGPGPGYGFGPWGGMGGQGMGGPGWAGQGWGGQGMGGPGWGGPGMGGPTWGGTYGQPMYYGGLPSDEDIRNMIFDSLDADPTIPYDSDIDVDVTGGLVTLTGTVPSKRIKHAVGDDAWWVPGVIDINNQLQISGRRGGRPGEGQAGQQGPQGQQGRSR